MSKALPSQKTPTGMSSGLLYELEDEIVITSFAERGESSPSIAFSRVDGSMTSSLHAELPQSCRPSSVFFGLLGLLHLRTGQHLLYTSHITRPQLIRHQALISPSSLPKRRWLRYGQATSFVALCALNSSPSYDDRSGLQNFIQKGFSVHLFIPITGPSARR